MAPPFRYLFGSGGEKEWRNLIFGDADGLLKRVAQERTATNYLHYWGGGPSYIFNVSAPPKSIHKSFSIHLGIVTPMANEADSGAALVREVLAQCVGVERVSYYVVLDNVCRDGTLDLLRGVAKTEDRLHVVWAPENRSVVDAYLRGYREAIAAGCDWILEIDGGFSHRPQDIPLFLDEMSKGYDCVFATRFAKGGRIEDSSLKRKYISWGGTFLTNLLLKTRLSDMTSGFEIFKREILVEAIPHIHSRGPFFQTEIKAYCHRFRYAEVPIVYRAASHNVSNASLKDALGNLWRMFRQRSARPQIIETDLMHAGEHSAVKH